MQKTALQASSPPPPLLELCRNLVDVESLKVHFHRLCLQSWQRRAFWVRRRGQTTRSLCDHQKSAVYVSLDCNHSRSQPPVNKYVPFKSSGLQVSLTLFYDPRLWRRGVLTGSASSQQMCSLQNHLTMSSVTQPSPFLHFCVHDCRGTRLSRPSGGISPDQSEGTPT